MDSLFSSRWYRVAGVHPSLRAHVRVSRHTYRGQIWYLLQDAASGRHHRVDETAFHFIGRMDGARTVDEIWHSMFNSLGERSPTQDDTIEMLCQLSENGLLQCEITPDVAELFRRGRQRARKRRMSMLNPLAFRVPLLDPDQLLTRLAPLARFLFHPIVAVLWAVVIGMTLLSVASSWETIRSFAAVHMLTPRYLLLMWITYPFIKALHELGLLYQTRPILPRNGTLASRSAATSARLRLLARARVSTAIGVSIRPGRMQLARMP